MFFLNVIVKFDLSEIKTKVIETITEYKSKTGEFLNDNDEKIIIILLIILLIILVAYILEWIKYKYKLLFRVNNDTVNLGQIRIPGELEKFLNSEQVALVIRSEFSAIKQCLEIMKRERLDSCPAQASSVDYYFFFSGLTDNTSITKQNTVIPKIKGIKNKPVLQTNINIPIGSFKIPVSDIYRALLTFVGLLPVRPRNRYKRSLINISFISDSKNAKAIVYREKVTKYKLISHYENAILKKAKKIECQEKQIERKNKIIDYFEKELIKKAKSIKKKNLQVFSETSVSSIEKLEDLNSLLRDVAFMILGLHNAFKCYWKSMRYLLDGFIEFSLFRNSGLSTARNNAKKMFEKAIVADPENSLEAMYYVAVMLMVERTNEAIETAINYFKHAERTENTKFRSLINLGLAFCYAQSYHRLGKTNEKMITEARNAINEVSKYWKGRYINKDQTINNELPLVPYMEAMINLVQAGNVKKEIKEEEKLKEKERLINEALNYAYESTKIDANNSMFKNIIGYALMDLANSGIEELQKEILAGEEMRNTSLLSEMYFQEALILNPKNKLTHANLCLLYSLPYFRKKNEEEHGLIYLKSRFHGLEAVTLDENYINGYRDLCLAYIRYKKVNEAEKCFYIALKLAKKPCKDAEIVKQIIKEANENNIPKLVIRRWSDLKPEYFEPV